MRVEVIVHPNSKKPRVEKDLLDSIHVYVDQPPLEGKANAATITALADYFKIKKSNVTLLSGAKTKHKVFELIPS